MKGIQIDSSKNSCTYYLYTTYVFVKGKTSTYSAGSSTFSTKASLPDITSANSNTGLNPNTLSYDSSSTTLSIYPASGTKRYYYSLSNNNTEDIEGFITGYGNSVELPADPASLSNFHLLGCPYLIIRERKFIFISRTIRFISYNFG